MTRRAVVVSSAWTRDLHEARYGLFLRLGMFMEALDKMFDEIDLLVFAPGLKNLTEDAKRFELHFQNEWTKRLKVNPCHKEPNPSPWSLYQRYLKPAVIVDRQEGFLNVDGPRQVEALRSILGRPTDLLFVHRLTSFGPVLRLKAQESLPPIAFDLDDIEHVALARSVLTNPRWRSERLRLLHVPALVRRERQAIRAATATFVCSTGDERKLKWMAGRSQIYCIPNAVVRLPASSVVEAKRQVVGFVGTFDYPPNVDAARILIERIWPRVRASFPSALLRIIGRGSERLRSASDGANGVSIEGYVDDIDEFYGECRLICAPIRIGSGTRIKIIEAAAYGVPVVTTALGAEGLEFAKGSEIAICRNEGEIIEECSRLLKDAEAALVIGKAAKVQFLLKYQRSAVVKRIADLMRQIAV